jgi:hypothetical protein
LGSDVVGAHHTRLGVAAHLEDGVEAAQKEQRGTLAEAPPAYHGGETVFARASTVRRIWMVQPGEIFLRGLAAVMFTVAAVLIGYFMIKVSRVVKHPLMPLYLYLEAVVVAVAVWRWIIFFLGFLTLEEVRSIEWFVDWVNPINQSLTSLLGFALVLHGIMNLRRMKHMAQPGEPP